MTTSPVRVRLSSPQEIVATIPWLVGFHPTDSIVIVCLHKPRGRIGLTMRVDAPAAAHVEVFAEQLASRVRRERPVAVILAGYGDVAPTLSTVADAMRSAKVAVRDVLHVDAGRWRSLWCTDEDCCPAAGRPLPPPESSPYAAPAIAEGAAVLGDRDEMVRSIQPLGGITRISMQQAIGRIDETSCDRTVALFDDAVARFVDPRAGLSDDESARLVLGLFDIAARDKVLARATGDGSDAFYALMRWLVRRAFPPYDAPACTALALTAYLHGDGALAQTAVERALATDPDYSFARLLLDGLYRQVPPAALRRALVDASQVV